MISRPRRGADASRQGLPTDDDLPTVEPPWLARIQRLIQDARRSGQLSPTVELHYTGRPVFVTEIANGMEKDMGGSSGGTLATIGVLFWLRHRRVRPLLWLLFLLTVTLGATVALGGLLFGTINVVSLGFGAGNSLRCT